MIEMASLVLFANDPSATAACYRAIGVELESEDHGDGLAHLATDLGGVHFAIFPADGGPARAPGWHHPGSSFPGFYVASLDAVLGRLEQLRTPVLAAHQQRPWGCRAIIEDPDGRAVEINQRGHCPAADDA
jgi:lactoylglutathione lyase